MKYTLLAFLTFSFVSSICLAQNNNFFADPVNSSYPLEENIAPKSYSLLAIGMGNIYYFYQGKNKNIDIDLEGATNDIGLSIRTKTGQSFYKAPRGGFELGYFFSTNVIAGFAASASVSKINKGPSGVAIDTIKLYENESETVIKTVANTFNTGLNLFFDTEPILYSIAAGPSFTILYHDIGRNDNSFLMFTGLGFGAEFAVSFKVNHFFSIPLNIFAAYFYPNFNSASLPVTYKTNGAMVAGAEIGVMFNH